MLQDAKLNFAPHTYLTKVNDNNYLASVIVPVPTGKTISSWTVTYMQTKTKVVATVIDDASSTLEFIKEVLVLDTSQTNPSKLEITINHGLMTYNSCDKYDEADDQVFDENDGIAYNCPHLHLATNGNGTFYPKVLVPLKGYEFEGTEDIVITSPENGICEATVRFHENPSVDEMFLFPTLNTLHYVDDNDIAGNVIAFVDLITNSSGTGSGSSSSMYFAAGPIIKRKKNKKLNKLA